MPRRRGNGLEYVTARRQAREATVWGLVAGAVAKAQAAHAAALHDLAGRPRAFLGEAALRAVHAPNREGSATLLTAMHRVVNGIWLGLIGPEAALYGYWIEWRTSNQLGVHLSMRDSLRLMGEGSTTSLHSSAPALLQALRTRHSMDAALYLNQAGVTYRAGVSKLDAGLHLLQPLDKDLEVSKVTIFVGGAGETPDRPRLTNSVYDGT